MAQVYARHVANGRSHDMATRRIEENDRVNAALVDQSKAHARVLVSMELAHNRALQA